MSSMYFIIFGILQDFTPKMLENRISGTLDFKISPPRLQNFTPPGPPRWSHAFGVRFAPPQK